MPVSRLRKNRKHYTGHKTPDVDITYHRPAAVKWFNYLAVVISLWFVIHAGSFYQPLFWCVLTFPAIGLILNGVLAHRPQADVLCKKEKSGKSTSYIVAGYIMLPAVCLLIRALVDVSYNTCSSFWVAIVVCFTLMCLLIAATHAPFRTGVRMFWVGAMLLLYSYGAVVLTNMMADRSSAAKYPVTVLEKRIAESRKSTTYYITVSEWPGHGYGKEVSETKLFYDSAYVGQGIYVYQYPGLFGIPWYYLNK